MIVVCQANDESDVLKLYMIPLDLDLSCIFYTVACLSEKIVLGSSWFLINLIVKENLHGMDLCLYW